MGTIGAVETEAASRTALLAGGSGLVGKHLLQRLLESAGYSKVVSVGRRALPIEHPKLEQRVVDMTAITVGGALPPIDDVFSCLGTTIKKAGSKEAFFAVDHDAVVAVAKAGRDAGAKRMFHVTALGADRNSRIFYNRVKGETEADVAALGLSTAIAFRPSIIDGDRAESRPAERVSLALMRAFAPVLGKYKPAHADAIAAAMMCEALRGDPGTRAVESSQILELAKR